MIDKQLILFYLINGLGGACVLGSYAHGLITNPLTRSDLWGGIPDSVKIYYTVFMFLAAGGYFFFTGYILIHVSTESVKLFGRYGFWMINMFYAGIILPSAIWIYLTFAMIENPDPLLWIIIRMVLFMVGFSSIALLASFLTSNFDRSSWLYFASIISLIFFCIQTMLLDALIWPYYYPK